jgi:hypothetical protein
MLKDVLAIYTFDRLTLMSSLMFLGCALKVSIAHLTTVDMPASWSL